MTISEAYELLSDELLLLPKQAEGEFEAYLTQLLAAFQRKMQVVAGRTGVLSADRLERIGFLNQSIRKAIQLGLACQTEAALTAVGEGLNAVENELFFVSERNTSVMQHQTLYRLVKSYPNFDPTRRDSVFHIPFEAKHRASAVRYSMQGHTSLYLGNSIYLCCLECDLFENNKLRDLSGWHASRFDLDFAHLKVLDLSASTLLLRSVLYLPANPPVPSFKVEPGRISNSPTGKDWEEYLSCTLTIWPLLAACSVKAVHASNDETRPEYLVPQLVMKWVQRNRDVGGIRFFSTREQMITSTQDISVNYALPAKAVAQARGHDPFLRQVARCTFPISIPEFRKKQWVPPGEAGAYEVAERNWRRLTLPTDHGGGSYFKTWFCNLEYELDRHETAEIESSHGSSPS